MLYLRRLVVLQHPRRRYGDGGRRACRRAEQSAFAGSSSSCARWCSATTSRPSDSSS